MSLKKQIIDEIISTFKIKRSLSKAGTPIDNVCAESIYNIVKTEFVFKENFASLDELELKWFDSVNCYNNVRIHGSLGYLTLNEFYSADSIYDTAYRQQLFVRKTAHKKID